MKCSAPGITVFILFCILPVLTYRAEAQYYTLGTDPSSISWNQVTIDRFKLIYPGDEGDLAARYGSLLQQVSGPVTASMPADIGSLAVILHPYTTYSNGSSILAPRRIELFPKQPLALETNDFASQLLIHELRHFAQMDRLNSGVTKAASYVLGDQAQSVVLGIHVPGWLLEGDAVLTETLLSHSGRGRIAGFIQPLRSRLIERRDLSWDRVNLGSFTDYLPDEYLFGYFLTARGRMLADPLLWSDALEQIGENPFLIKGLSGITRPKTGFRFSKLYVETLEWLYDFWTNPALLPPNPVNLVTLAGDSLVYANYYRPYRSAGGTTICLKKSLDDIPAFVRIDSLANEQIIHRPGYMEDAGFTLYGNRLLWAELIRDPRWENRSWSDLFLFDIQTLKPKRLTYEKRYFSPVFSPDGTRIAVIEEKVDGSSWLQVIDSYGFDSITSIKCDATDHFSFICWGAVNNELYAISTGEQGRKLIKTDLATGNAKVLLTAGFLDIAHPVFHEGWIYFSGPAGTTQGLFRIAAEGGLPQQVFRHRHGINYLNAQGDELLLSAFSADGYRPAKIAFKYLNGKPVTRLDPLEEPVTGIIERAEGEQPVVKAPVKNLPESRPYPKITHLFRLHSWSPVFLNPDSYQISPGVVLMSQNELSTLTSWAGYQYHKTDRSHNLLASLHYTGLYPEIDLDYTRKFRYPANDSTEDGESLLKFPGYYWQFFRISSGIPLDYSSGAWSRRLKPNVFFERINEIGQGRDELVIQSWMVGVSLESAVLRKRSYRDLFPRWGISMNMSYFSSFNPENRQDNFTGRILLYLPGFIPNSSIRILNSFLSLSTGPFFNSIQDFPRGQLLYEARRAYNFKIDYSFPVLYPDYHISWLLYVKRMRTNFFYDAGYLPDRSEWFKSAGMDLTFDYNLLRSGIDLDSGLRILYFPATRNFGTEFLFSFSVK